VWEHHPNWKGGHRGYSEFWQKIKKNILDRNNYICQLCGITNGIDSNPICCHHIDYNRNNMKESNLVTLCKKCNGRVNSKREYWVDYFHNLLQQKFGYSYNVVPQLVAK